MPALAPPDSDPQLLAAHPRSPTSCRTRPRMPRRLPRWRGCRHRAAGTWSFGARCSSSPSTTLTTTARPQTSRGPSPGGASVGIPGVCVCVCLCVCESRREQVGQEAWWLFAGHLAGLAGRRAALTPPLPPAPSCAACHPSPHSPPTRATPGHPSRPAPPRRAPPPAATRTLASPPPSLCGTRGCASRWWSWACTSSAPRCCRARWSAARWPTRAAAAASPCASSPGGRAATRARATSVGGRQGLLPPVNTSARACRCLASPGMPAWLLLGSEPARRPAPCSPRPEQHGGPRQRD